MRPSPNGRGTLFLVVGPSGAGKDSLIDAARQRLAANPGVVFVRRTISRLAEAGGEQHRPVTADEFDRLEASGAFALAWRAHALRYGIPREIHEDLASGRHVVANVSRTVIDEARQRFGPVRIIQITAPPEVLARRLAERGRESREDVAERLRRAGMTTVSGGDVTTIVNDRSLEDAIARFLAALAEEDSG